MDDEFKNRVGGDRIASRQIDELIGIARGVAADGALNQKEVEFLQKWLAASEVVSNHPVIRTLYTRIDEALSDGNLDSDECTDLLDTLEKLSSRDFELGEVLKSTTLPLCDPAPNVVFIDRQFCFTGTFLFGQRKFCEKEVEARGGRCSGLNRKVDFLVIGHYATESWKHSSFGNKIISAVEWRECGVPISIVSEEHWFQHLEH